MSDETMKRRVELWDAINEYASLCGGDPSKHISVGRMAAVAKVEKLVFGSAPAQDRATRVVWKGGAFLVRPGLAQVDPADRGCDGCWENSNYPEDQCSMPHTCGAYADSGGRPPVEDDTAARAGKDGT